MRSREPGEVRRRQIADAALKVIAEDGLGRFTTAAIAREVGITEGALFRHFESKEAIVDAAVARVEQIFTAQQSAGDGDPLEQLGAFVRARVAVLRGERLVARVVFSDQLEQASASPAAGRVAALKRRSMAFIRDRLRAAQAAGVLVDGVELEGVAALVHGVALSAVFGPGEARDAAARAALAWETLERLVRRRAPRARHGRDRAG